MKPYKAGNNRQQSLNDLSREASVNVAPTTNGYIAPAALSAGTPFFTKRCTAGAASACVMGAVAGLIVAAIVPDRKLPFHKPSNAALLFAAVGGAFAVSAFVLFRGCCRRFCWGEREVSRDQYASTLTMPSIEDEADDNPEPYQPPHFVNARASSQSGGFPSL